MTKYSNWYSFHCFSSACFLSTLQFCCTIYLPVPCQSGLLMPSSCYCCCLKMVGKFIQKVIIIQKIPQLYFYPLKYVIISSSVISNRFNFLLERSVGVHGLDQLLHQFPTSSPQLDVFYHIFSDLEKVSSSLILLPSSKMGIWFNVSQGRGLCRALRKCLLLLFR